MVAFRHNNDTFINESKKIHGNKYNYDKVKYTKSSEKIIITCKIHGDFLQRASNHLLGIGCKKCGINLMQNKISDNNEKFINKAKKIHGNKYNYDKVNYNYSKEQVIITCKIHGDFLQTPQVHLKGSNCPKCAQRSNTIEWLEKTKKIHGDKYDYNVTIYNHSEENLLIKCKIHGYFEQLAANHLRGHGCPFCSNFGQPSKAELEIVDFLKELNIKIITSNRQILKTKELDIYLPEYNLAIEFNGLYWHNELKKDDNYHLEKTNECKSLGIQLIHIFEDEWLNKKNIVKSRLINLLKKNTNKIYARETIIKEIDNEQYRNFVENNHLQGYVAGKIYLGLFYTLKSTGKEYLVSVMSFGSLRKSLGNENKNNHYELLRFCNTKFVNVIGGASKLLKYFEKHYNPEYIISYADKRWSQGNLYKQLKFELIRESKPNYFYVNGLKRENRFNYRKDILISKYNCPLEMTEREFMFKIKKYYRIYDCGNYVFEKIYLS